MLKPWMRRTLAFLLAACMLTGVLTACGEPEETIPEETKETVAATEAETELSDELPELDFGGDELVILSRYREGWTSGEISVEKNNGEAVNDAVYERNLVVEDRLHVTINSIEEHENDPHSIVNAINKAVSTGSNDYDMAASACYAMLNESLNGTFADLRRTEYIQFEKPYWSQGFNEVVEYKDMQFGITGSIVLSMYRFAFVTVFNKRMFDAANVDYLYDTVREGKWTLDYQTSIVPLFHQDDGNGKQDKDTDIYGLATNDYISVDPYWSSCNVPILDKDENGDYVLVFDSGKLHEVAEKLMLLFYGTDNATYDHVHYGLDDEQDDIRDMFADGRAAMATLRLMALESGAVRDMKDEYGVVPMPKFDEEQKEYCTLLHDQFTVMSVPTTVRGERLDEVSAVLEALCSESWKRVKPAYYETTLRTKIMKDPDSAEMLDLCIEKIHIDAGIIYTEALSSFHSVFRDIMGSKKNSVVSRYKSTTRSTKRALQKMQDKLSKLAEAA